jgi:hypothetical protein
MERSASSSHQTSPNGVPAGREFSGEIQTIMASSTINKPVEDSIAKVNDEIAVGSDPDFQRRWLRFEHGLWAVFTLIVVLDLLGFFGRGYMAKATARTNDGSLDVQYDRVERYSTPSIMTVQFGPSAIRDGKVQLWVSEGVIKSLGAQRVVPQPASSVVGQGGILYTFPATSPPFSAGFQLEPTSPGMFEMAMRVPGGEEVRRKILVMP